MKYIVIVMLAFFIHGCGSSDASEHKEDDVLSTCLGAPAPSFSINVRDSESDLRLSKSKVQLHYIGSNTTGPVAEYDTSTSKYFTHLEGWNEGKVGIVVTNTNYHPAVLKNVDFKVSISCGAKNEFNYDVYLCPIGSSCLP